MDKQTVKDALFSINEAIAALEAARGDAPKPASDNNREYVNWMKISSAISQLKFIVGVIEEVAK